ncbi:MAG: DUF2442 domain-containing protein [Alphaproteobacteria bacterium]|nr:DUF2442 domain-containing protein [Alphaproteobacteria bacterium]
MYRVVQFLADPKTRELTLTWDGGAVTTKSMTDLIARKKLFKPLADDALFQKAHLINEGRAVAWNAEIDICVDALWYDAHPEDNPFTSPKLAKAG